MAEVKITITIPSSEYEGWNEFEDDGVEAVKMVMRKDVTAMLRHQYIQDFEVETEFIDN